MNRAIVASCTIFYAIFIGLQSPSGSIKRLHGCPQECNCSSTSLNININCNNRKLSSFPNLLDLEIPPTAEGLRKVGTNEKADIHILVNGNRFRYLLRNKLKDVASRLAALEIEDNEHVIDIPPKVFTDLMLYNRLEILHLGPIRGDISQVVHWLQSSTNLVEVSVTGTDREYGEENYAGDVSGNTKDRLELRSFPTTLRVLRLVKVGVVEVDNIEPTEGLTLKELALIGAQLKIVPTLVTVVMTSTLLRLDLSHNLIRDLWEPDGARRCILVSVNLSYNRLAYLEDGVFEGCHNLREIDLSYNPFLIAIGAGSMQGLSALTLDLSFTGITSLEDLSPNKVAELRLFSAGLVCDCNQQNILHTWLQTGQVKGTCRHGKGDAATVLDLSQLKQDCSVTYVTKAGISSPGCVSPGKNEASQIANGEDSDNFDDEKMRVDKHPCQICNEEDIGVQPSWYLNSHVKPRMDDREQRKIVKDGSNEKVSCIAAGASSELNQTIEHAEVMLGHRVMDFKSSPERVFIYMSACLFHTFLTFAAFLTAGHTIKT